MVDATIGGFVLDDQEINGSLVMRDRLIIVGAILPKIRQNSARPNPTQKPFGDMLNQVSVS